MLRMLTFRNKNNIDSNSLIKVYGLDEYGIIDCPPNGIWFVAGTTPVDYTEYVPFVLDTTKYEFICVTPTFFRWSLTDGGDGENRIHDKDSTFIHAFHHLNSLIK